MFSNSNTRGFKTQPVRHHPTTADLQPAPVDEHYAEQGYAYLVGKDSARHSLCSGIIASQVRPGFYYSVATFYRTADNKNDCMILRLDANGKIEKTLVRIDDYLADQSFMPEDLIEDTDGKLLCKGSVRTAGIRTTRIWRFNPEGDLDLSFAGKGFIDSDDLKFNSGLFQIIAHPSGYFVTGSNSTYLLVSLNADGRIDTGFGKLGFVDLSAIFPQPIIGSLGLRIAALGQNSLVTTIVEEDEFIYSLLAKITADGNLDTNFADEGLYKAENGTIYHNFSVHAPSGVITLCGSHTSDDFVTEYPDVQRLGPDGKPWAQFNGGTPLRFDTPGGWSHMHESEGRLMGWGGFYNHSRAVCYTLEGQLDTSFAPPDGYGRVGVDFGAVGFQPETDASVAFVADPKRMLVCGQYFYNNDKSADAVVTAIAHP